MTEHNDHEKCAEGFAEGFANGFESGFDSGQHDMLKKVMDYLLEKKVIRESIFSDKSYVAMTTDGDNAIDISFNHL